MIELNTILKKAELFEKLAIYGNRKDFLLKISQESSDPMGPTTSEVEIRPSPDGDTRMSKYYDSVWRWESFLNKIENLNSEQDKEKLKPLIPEFNRIGENIKNFIIQFETNPEIINAEKTSELKTMLNRVKKMQEKWTGQQHRIKRVENSVSPTSELSPISTYTVSEYI